jgi:hypothetical protein
MLQMLSEVTDLTKTKELMLPRLIGSRDQACQLAGELGDLRDQVVTLNGRELRAASSSSADEFVQVILVEGQAARLEVLSGTPEFIRDVETSAHDHDVAARLAVASTH